MKLIYLGTPQFAVPTLKALNSSHHQVVAVVTQPEKQAGRGQKLKPSPVEQVAKQLGIPVYSFNRISKNGVETLKQIDADAIVTCAYGQILSQEILTLKKFGVLNVHGSVLPKYRGSSPVQWTILNGEPTGGISILKSDVGIDDGDVLTTFETPILENETSEQLFTRLSELAPSVLLPVLNSVQNGTAVYTPQDHSQATVCKKLTKEMSQLSFAEPVLKIVNTINGLNMWPVAQVNYQDVTLKLFHAKVLTQTEIATLNLQPLSNYQNGEVVVSNSKKGLVVKASDGFLQVLELQAPNGKRMDAKSYLNGKQITMGSVLQ